MDAIGFGMIIGIGLVVIVTAVTVGWLVARYVLRQATPQDGDDDGMEPVLMALAETQARIRDVETSMAARVGELGERSRQTLEQIGSLAGVLASHTTRGGWGELSLRRALESAGLVEGRDYELQLSGPNGRPDAVVRLPGGRRLVIDAKFPVARFAQAMESEDADERDRMLMAHASDLEAEAKSLRDRGYHQEAAGGFVVMYLPAETLFVEALRVRPDLYERLLTTHRVLLAGPTTLLSVLSAAGQVIAEHRVLAEAEQVMADAKELRDRVGTFAGHLEKMGRGLSSAVSAYNQGVGSFTTRLLPSADRVANRAGLDGLQPLDPVDLDVRDFSADDYPASA